MMQKFKLVFLVIFLLSVQNLLSYDWLWIEDPQNPWRDGQGTIEEAVLSIKPKGLYTECGLYLTISGKGLGFSNTDTLEIQYYFELPEGAIVHDSWLWIGEDIIKGKIYDKWTAASIYEEIVNRRRDPSILFKRGQRQYELRIFPMAGDESRKVKLTFLLPTQWSSKSVVTTLPLRLLNVSKDKINNFYLLTWLDEEWKNPKIIEFPDKPFEKDYDDIFGNFLQSKIPVEATRTQVNYSVDSPFDDGIYVNAYGNNDEGFYQMALLPSQTLDLENTSIKTAFLFDHMPNKTDVSTNDILSNVKNILHSNFSSKDSFNLIFSKLDIKRASDSWISADSLSIESTFNDLGSEPISNYSNLPSLISDAINFVQDNGNSGSLFLISSSDQVGDYQIANDLIEDIMEKMDPVFPIHIADYSNWNVASYWIGGRYYRGNEYFFTNLSRITTGNYLQMRNGYSISDLLLNLTQSLSAFITSFDIHTSLESGFCFGRYNLNTNQQTYLDKPILQTGKFNGDFPFIIDMAGEYENNYFGERITLNVGQINQADSLNRKMWVGNYIESLEKEQQTNDIVAQIIDASTQERILSIYTAFLCLEPARGGEICYDCLDESVLVSVNDSKNEFSDSTISVYPNPFNSQVNIKIPLAGFDKKNIDFRVYNVAGKVVKSFKNIDLQDENALLKWDGRNNYSQTLSSGTYFFRVFDGKKQKTIKLLFIK